MSFCCSALPIGELVPGSKGVSVIRAEHPQADFQQLSEGGSGPGRVACLSVPMGDSATRTEGAGVVGALHTLLVV